jgi:hypothetical protein
MCVRQLTIGNMFSNFSVSPILRTFVCFFVILHTKQQANEEIQGVEKVYKHEMRSCKCTNAMTSNTYFLSRLVARI